MRKLLTILLIILGIRTSAQVAIGTSVFTPDASAMLEIQSTNKGVLVPRIDYNSRPGSPVNGCLIYVIVNGPSGDNSFYYFDSGSWKRIGGDIVTGTGVSGQVAYWSGTGTVSGLAPGNAGNIVVSNGTNFTSGSLTTASTNLGSNVTIATAGTFYDGPSVSLAPGTWFIVATVQVTSSSNSTLVTAKLWDGTTVQSSGEQTCSNAQPQSITLSGIVTLSTTTNMKVSVTAQASNKASIRAATPDNPAGNNASHIRAIRIGP